MIQRITIDCWLKVYSGLPVVDVRSPGEFQKGHIPGAVNIPVFSDDERAEVSIAHNQISVDKAVEMGHHFVEPKLMSFKKKLIEIAPNRELVVHCLRGGMRSRAFAAHFEEKGFKKIYILDNGYKGYRNFVQDFFTRPFNLRVLGGFSGSGKTEILRCLEKKGEQVIDLEGLAHHKGSAFGGIGMPLQPTTEQFENDLFTAMKMLDPLRQVWIEDESIAIGRVYIPNALFARMNAQSLFFLKIPQHERVGYLVEEYSGLNKGDLAESIKKITKRLGAENEKLALKELDEGNMFRVAEIMLSYYDKYYLKGLQKRVKSKISEIEFDIINPEGIANHILQLLRTRDNFGIQ